MSVDGGCEAVATARTRYWWIKLKESGELLYGWTYFLRLKVAVYKSYARPAILHQSETLWLKNIKIIFLQRIEIYGANNVWRADQRW